MQSNHNYPAAITPFPMEPSGTVILSNIRFLPPIITQIYLSGTHYNTAWLTVSEIKNIPKKRINPT